MSDHLPVELIDRVRARLVSLYAPSPTGRVPSAQLARDCKDLEIEGWAKGRAIAQVARDLTSGERSCLPVYATPDSGPVVTDVIDATPEQ